MKIIEMDDYDEGTEMLTKLHKYFGSIAEYESNQIFRIINCRGSETVQILTDGEGYYIDVSNDMLQNKTEIVEFLINN